MYIVHIWRASFITLSLVLEVHSFLVFFNLFCLYHGRIYLNTPYWSLSSSCCFDPISLSNFLYAAGRLANTARCSGLLWCTTEKAQAPACLGWSIPADMHMQERTARAKEVVLSRDRRKVKGWTRVSREGCRLKLWHSLCCPSRSALKIFLLHSKPDFFFVWAFYYLNFNCSVTDFRDLWYSLAKAVVKKAVLHGKADPISVMIYFLCDPCLNVIVGK